MQPDLIQIKLMQLPLWIFPSDRNALFKKTSIDFLFAVENGLNHFGFNSQGQFRQKPCSVVILQYGGCS